MKLQTAYKQNLVHFFVILIDWEKKQNAYHTSGARMISTGHEFFKLNGHSNNSVY